MSLVAAYSDSDNDESEDETSNKESILENEASKQISDNEQNNDVTNEQIFDEDIWESNVKFEQQAKTNDENVLFAKLPQPKQNQVNKFADEDEDLEDEFLAKKANPIPNIEKDNTLQTENIEKKQEGSLRSFMNLPKPSKSKGKVQISLPSLHQIGSDNSDDDDDAGNDNTSKTNVKPLSTRSSLFSRLPKPKHSVTVAMNKNRVFEKQENRSLIPHALTKTKEKNIPVKKTSKCTQNIINDSDSEDDSDFTSGNFFSFDQSKSETKSKVSNETVIPKPNANISTNSPVTNIIDKEICEENKNKNKNNSYFASLLNKSKVYTTNKNNEKQTELITGESSQSSIFNLKSSESINSSVTLPYTTATSNQATLKDNTTRYSQNNKISVVNNSVAAPYNTSSKQNDSVTAPYISSSVITSSNKLQSQQADPVTAPYGSNYTASNNKKCVDNSVIAPYPSNAVPPSFDKSMQQVSSVTAPYGNTSGQGSTVTALYGNTSGQGSAVTVPYGNTSGQGSSVTAPYGNTSGQGSAVTAPYGNTSGQGSSVTAPYGNTSEQGSNVTAGSYSQYNVSNPMQTDHTHSYPQDERFFQYSYKNNQSVDESHIDYYNQPNQDNPLDQQAIVALQGKGKKRHKEEINIIDVNAANLQMSKEEYLKNISTQPTYRAKKPKSEEPSSKQKRKHQITYLAFQAREREHELQQAWAENRQTRQQTQSKYGF